MAAACTTLVFDGDCAICRSWVSYWQRLTNGRVIYRPYQEAAADFPTIPHEAFERAIWLIEPDGRVYSGAGAALRPGPRRLVVDVHPRPRFRCGKRVGLHLLCTPPGPAHPRYPPVVGSGARAQAQYPCQLAFPAPVRRDLHRCIRLVGSPVPRAGGARGDPTSRGVSLRRAAGMGSGCVLAGCPPCSGSSPAIPCCSRQPLLASCRAYS